MPSDAMNQPPSVVNRDLWSDDRVLQTHFAGSVTDELRRYARILGRQETTALAREANRNPPRLESLDRAGRRRDEVVFHPSYHSLMTLGLEAGYSAGPWTGGTHEAHAAMVYLTSQTEPGVCCPMTMTYAAQPVLSTVPELSSEWTPKLFEKAYDPRPIDVGRKAAVTVGMAMTEKQGGSDLRNTATRAEPADDRFRLQGHKWFCSAPMSDGFLTLAQSDEGLTCFFVPRWLPDGANAIHLIRLKEKLGNRANASAEIEYHGALAHRVGEFGQGIRTIIEMVHHTRLDTAIAPAGLMRGALVEAHHWVTHRSAFQRRLIDQPLMRAVLADLVLDWEGATALAMRVARSFDDPAQAPFARLSVALAKYLNNKLCPRVTYEAMEILGGSGFVEDTPMPMYYREAPLNSIWEGAGNVICLDILRTLQRSPEAREALDVELDAGRSGSRAYDRAISAHRDRWPDLPPEAEARWFCESAALLLTASVLFRSAPNVVADAFASTRLDAAGGRIAGSHTGLECDAIVSRLVPVA